MAVDIIFSHFYFNPQRSVEEGADYGKGGEGAEGAEVGGVVLDEEVEDGVAVGAGEAEKVHVAKCDARESDEGFGLCGIDPLGMERRGLAENAG